MLPAWALGTVASRWAWKALPFAFLALLAGFLWLRGETLQARLEAAQERATAATERAVRAEKNGKLAVTLMARHTRVAEERAVRIRELERRIRNAGKPVPPGCEGVLDPLRVAVDGLRGLRVPATPAAAVPAGTTGATADHP